MNKLYALSSALFLIAACSSVPTVPHPDNEQASALGIFVKVRVSGLASYRADIVYFVRKCPANETCEEKLLPSDYAKDGRVYLLNVAPGEYRAVAAAFESGMLGDNSLYFAYFPESLRNNSAIIVRTPGFAYIGSYAVAATMGLCPDEAEPAQLKYAEMIEPETPKCGFWQPLLHKLAKADLIFIGGKAYSVGKQTFHYRATAYELTQSTDDVSTPVEQAQMDLGGAGWKFGK